ncbi:DUF2905 domain-containing protein [Pontibacter sp. 13R65]|uniref:DUF2905 domain-containing protein n=1 Tax=Pontibacter sp. 13R65 TaxID=3127458 RepID=UPI00301D563E
MPSVGKAVVLIGVVIVVIGLVIWLAGDKFNWFGQLPGDINVERKNFRFFAPITSMLLFSILFSLILWVIRRFF